MNFQRGVLLFLLVLGMGVISLWSPQQTYAGGPMIGIHLLDPAEIIKASELITTEANPGVVTIPLRTDDLDLVKWQRFFNEAHDRNVRPIIRLTTSFTDKGWARPTKKDIVELANFLTTLNWRQDQLTVIIFNETNHANEWGGEVKPEEYAETLDFALNWFHTEKKRYIVLPAGLDAAAGDTSETMDSFKYLQKMFEHQPEIVEKIDGWTSHSYPNHGFVAPPNEKTKHSVSGFVFELEFLKKYTDRELPVYITETGWRNIPSTSKLLEIYYSFAFSKVWNNPAIAVVTPFVFSAATGPFSEFSFLDPNGHPNAQYSALLSVIKKKT